MMHRRTFMAGTAAAGATAAFATTARGQSTGGLGGWPSRPVRTIVPSGAGGPSANFRIYGDHFQEVFGQAFILENQPGASGAIGVLNVVRSAPDGHTLLCASNSHVILAPLVAPKPVFDVKKDLVPIGVFFTFPLCMVVNADLPVKNLTELVAYAKARPGQLNYGSIGVGTGTHLMTELFCKRAGFDAVHIPYTGTGGQIQGVASGTLQFVLDTVGNSRGVAQAGRVRQLAVTGPRRTAGAPDLPTFAEEGFPGFELLLWISLLGPAGTPKPVIEALNREMVRCSRKPEVKARLQQSAFDVSESSPADFAIVIDQELALWKAVVQETGLKIPS